METGPRILIVGPAWVGDMVMAQSLFITLKQQDPSAEIDVVAPAWSLPLLARMPEVRRAIALPVGHGQVGLAARWRIGRSLRSERYTKAIILPRSFKAALIPFLAGVPLRTGYRGELRYGLINDMRRLDKARLPQVVQRYVALGLSDDASSPPSTPEPRLRIDEGRRTQLLRDLGLSLQRPVVAFMPGAEYGPAKRWPTKYYSELAGLLSKSGITVWILGSQRDHAVAAAISGNSPDVINLCGRTGLEDVVDLLSVVNAAVTNDSGLMHMAAAVNIPMVAIYGSSSPEYTPPLSGKAMVMYRRLKCSPCFERQCQLGTYQCLYDISVSDVMSGLQKIGLVALEDSVRV